MVISILQIIAVIGTILTGLYSILAPTKIEGFTGIKPIGGRGITEIRSVFGGLFAGLGMATFFLDSAIAYPMLGIMYLAIGVIQAISMVLDKSIERSNIISLAVEILFGIVLVI